MANYFNSLSFRQKLQQIGQCRFMSKDEFSDGIKALKNKKIVILGCGAQGLNQGLNMRDSGLDVSFALRTESITAKNSSWQRATQQHFNVGTFEELIPNADLVLNLTPDKQHNAVINKVQPLMKQGATLGYSHGFNIVEEGQRIRADLTVVMVAPKCPGTEVREEYKRGFGVPTLIAVHQENDPEGKGWEIAKAWAVGTGGDRAGVLASSFVAEVKSDLMGEQTILCGLLQTGTLFCYDALLAQGKDAAYSAKLLQYGWETITEALKQGGITLMMDRLSNAAKLRAFQLADQIKQLLTPLYYQHLDDIISGKFSEEMIHDWHQQDKNLLMWREATRNSGFEQAGVSSTKITEQDYFDHGLLMVALIKAGVELTFDTMLEVGILPESSYYESLHELPLIANTIARKRLYEMNVVISDTAEYGNYLFSNSALPLLKQHLTPLLQQGDLGEARHDQHVTNHDLLTVNQAIRQHPIEITGKRLRGYMTAMKNIEVAAK